VSIVVVGLRFFFFMKKELSIVHYYNYKYNISIAFDIDSIHVIKQLQQLDVKYELMDC